MFPLLTKDRSWLSAVAAVAALGWLIAGADARAQQSATKKRPAPKVTTSNATWPQFLGPNRDGLSTETGLLDSWPASGPREVWRVSGGVGMSGLAISGGRMLTLVQRDGRQWLLSLDAANGSEVWKSPLAPAYENPMGDGPRGTPTIAGTRVFAFTGEGILAAVDFQSGELLWSHDTVRELDGEVAEYGMACSPLVVGDQVIVTVGAPQATVAAYDAASGKRLWTAQDDVAAGYSSPAVRNVGGLEQVLVFTGGSALGLALGTGNLLWRYPYETNFNCNIATPLGWDGQAFISSGENHGCALLKLTPSGDGFSAAPTWESLGPRSVMRNEWQTSMLIDGYLYGMDNVGGAGPVTHLNCVNIASGKRVWQQQRFGKGNLIAAEGKLFISTMDGELVIVRASPKAYAEIGRGVVLGPTRQAPALAGWLLYLRDDQEIVCLDVRRQ
jgi:outer membrane protein assembly factor BamB